MSADKGGPAFPEHIAVSTVGDTYSGAPGMDLRDYLAGKVLQGLAANPGGPWQANDVNGWSLANCTLVDVVEVAYQTADAALVERAK